MGLLDTVNASTLQFVADALRTMVIPPADLTTASGRGKLNTPADVSSKSGRPAIRNPDGTAMTVAQIAAAANLTVAQVTDLAGRV